MQQLGFHSVLQVTGLVSLLWFGHVGSHLLGGLLMYLVSMLTDIPVLGRVFNFLLYKKAKLITIIRLMTWGVAASGMLLGLLIFTSIWGEPDQKIELIIITSASILFLTQIVHEILGFTQPTADSMIHILDKYGPDRVQKGLKSALEVDRSRLMLLRMTFVDQSLVRFFNMLVNIGVMYYGFGQLGVFQSNSADLPSLWESLYISFTINDLLGQSNSPFYGNAWNIIHAVSTFLVFYWVVVFIAMTASSPEKDSENYLSSQSDLDIIQSETNEHIVRSGRE